MDITGDSTFDNTSDSTWDNTKDNTMDNTHDSTWDNTQSNGLHVTNNKNETYLKSSDLKSIELKGYGTRSRRLITAI